MFILLFDYYFINLIYSFAVFDYYFFILRLGFLEHRVKILSCHYFCRLLTMFVLCIVKRSVFIGVSEEIRPQTFRIGIPIASSPNVSK